MAAQKRFTAHPRLYVGSEEISRLQNFPGEGLVARVNETMQKDANRFARRIEVPFDGSGHNEAVNNETKGIGIIKLTFAHYAALARARIRGS